MHDIRLRYCTYYIDAVYIYIYICCEIGRASDQKPGVHTGWQHAPQQLLFPFAEHGWCSDLWKPQLNGWSCSTPLQDSIESPQMLLPTTARRYGSNSTLPDTFPRAGLSPKESGGTAMNQVDHESPWLTCDCTCWFPVWCRSRKCWKFTLAKL